MAGEMSTHHMVKFNGSNFQTWKFQVISMLDTYDIFDVVNGVRVKPEDMTTADGKKWKKDNARAKYILSSTMNDTQLETVIVCETAQDIWRKLTSIHEQKSETNKLLLWQRYQECRMDPSDSVINYSTKVQNLARALKDIGENVCEASLIAKILGGLPVKYNALVVAWDSVDSASQTLENLQERLLKEEKRMSAKDEETTALTATNFKQQQNRGSEKQKSLDRTKGEIICFFCKKPGHIARKCRKRRFRARNQQTNDTGAFIVTTDDNKGQQQEVVCEQSNRLLGKDYVRDVWILDSGASRHLTFRREWFVEFNSCVNENIMLGDNGMCEVEGVGTVLIRKLIDGQWFSSKIENVLYVPKLRKNLFSVGVCTSLDYRVSFCGGEVKIYRNRNLMAKGIKQDNQIYRMMFEVVQDHQANLATTDMKQWHERLAHVNKKTLQEMASKELVIGMKISHDNLPFCEGCQFGKSHRLPFKKSQETKIKYQPGEFFHTDVCGHMQVDSLGGSRYYLLFKDEATGYRFVYFLKHKSDVFERAIRNKFNRPMKILHSDNGGEYWNDLMKEYNVRDNCPIYARTKQEGRTGKSNYHGKCQDDAAFQEYAEISLG